MAVHVRESVDPARPDRLLTALPANVPALIGRDDELALVLDRVRTERLVTLVGTGGVGKTRLGVEAAHRLLAGADAVGFVELADVVGAAGVMNSIADQLAVTVVADAEQSDGLVHLLSVGPTILVIDNFEQVLDAAPDIAALLDACPSLHVLVTSRLPLSLDGETTIVVTPLPTGGVPIGGASSAVRLFFERAGIASPSATDVEAARRITAALGGLPLAIELAAARARTLGAATVYELLVRDLSLDGLARLTPDDGRHGSVRACIEWSVRALDENARDVFRTTGAFAGGFDLDALRAVERDGQSTAAGLAVLVDHHLIDRIDMPSGASRFTSIPPIREYARELLDREADHAAIHDAHAAYFAQRAVEIRRMFERTAPETAIEEFQRDEANINLAAYHRQRTGDLTGAAQIAADLADIAIEFGREARVAEWIRELAVAAEAQGTELTREARIWAAYADLRDRVASSADAPLETLDAAVADARAAGDEAAVVVGFSRVAHTFTAHGDVLRAIEATVDGVALASRLGLRRPLAEFTMWQAMLEHVAGDIPSACEHGLDALAIARELDDRRLVVRIGLLFAPMTAGGEELPASLDAESIPTLEACLEAARACGSILDELYVTMQLAIRAGFNGRSDACDWVLYGMGLADRARSHRAELIFVLALAGAALNAHDDADAARFHAAVRAEWMVIATLIPQVGRDHYERLVEKRRAVDPERFDEMVRDASAVVWADVVAAATDYARRGAQRQDRGPLTERERDVLQELAAGRTNKEIAVALGMRPKTVMHHCATIYRKLGVKNRSEATATALRMGLVAHPE